MKRLRPLPRPRRQPGPTPGIAVKEAADSTSLPATTREREFFRRDAIVLARALLGTVLIHEAPDGVAAGRIVEVEAYRGPEDRAAHSYGGRRTPRTETMFGEAGHAYVYFVYGMHYCFNVVAAEVGRPEAVLVRALEPLSGIELMRARRGLAAKAAEASLARGPANLCRAMGIDRRLNGADLLSGSLRIESGRALPPRSIGRTTRVGVAYAGEHANRLWRFYERGNPAVSAPASSRH